MSKKTFIELAVEYVHETDAAVLINLGTGDDIWIPKSQLNDFPYNHYAKGDDIEIECTEWFATKEGLI